MTDPIAPKPFRTLAGTSAQTPQQQDVERLLNTSPQGMLSIRTDEEMTEDEFRRGILMTSVDAMVNWSRANSIWPLGFGLACCAIEMMAGLGPRFDISRFGAEVMRPSPRQADLMIVAGRVSVKMAPALRVLYDQMPDPKWVIAMGACASCGGVFNNYAIVQGVDKIVPVDVYVPGCPPRPESLIHGIMKLQEKILASRTEVGPRPRARGKKKGAA
jgi:NADH-quinone oxidoreductase subunit B